MFRHHLRILDANGNRAAEGLRVLEDVARFLLDDAALGERAKHLRHTIRQAIPTGAIAARDTASDVGTTITAPGEMERSSLTDVIRANAARACEALRAAEESAKLSLLGAAAAALEQTRYGTYQLESALLARLSAWRFQQIKLYALIDTTLTSDPLGVAVAVAKGGAGAVQLRSKELSLRAYRELAARMHDAVRAHGALFVVNDHVAIARALNADAVHIGQDDLSINDTRAVVGPLCAIGLSCHTSTQLDEALSQRADYVGLGPMYATATKAHEPAQGPQLLDAVRDRLKAAQLPSYAIGGLNRERVQLLRDRLPHGIAVTAALCKAADPERAAAELRALLDAS